MQDSREDQHVQGTRVWTSHLMVLAVSIFVSRLGQGLVSGVSTNFFVDVLGLSGSQVLALAGIREIPGLLLMGIAAFLVRLPVSRRAAGALVLMGLGYGLYSVVQSYSGLIAMALLASIGFHNWMPMQSALSLGLSAKRHTGRVMGSLSSVGALASITGMAIIALLSPRLTLRAFPAFGGAAMMIGGLLLLKLPKNLRDGKRREPRLLLRRRYWLYYVLILFEGSRTQVFAAFGTLVLVQSYELGPQQISLVLGLSGLVSFLVVPQLGRLIDRWGERATLSVGYVALAMCFVGYATVRDGWFLSGMLILINLLVTLSMGLSTYVNRIAPPGELSPTLAAGVSVNHITSVSMSFVAGALLPIVGYQTLAWGAAAIIFLSVPFALAIPARPAMPLEPESIASS